MKRFIFVLAAGLVLPGSVAAYPPSINEYFGENRTHPVPVIYELPEGSGRDKAVAYIKEIRESFYKDSELIDAADHSLEELGSKISGGFILYAVPGAKTNLLRSIKSPRLEFASQGLKFNGKELSGKLRIITIAANPYSDGACQIFAAPTNELLVGINGLFHGPASYYVFKDGKEKLSGMYDGNYNFISGTLSMSAAMEDVNEFFSKAESIHPDLLANLEPGEYQALKRRTVDAISGKLDKERRIRIQDLAYELYYAAAAFGDGHTSLQYYNLPESDFQAARYPPFRLEFRNGAFYVQAAIDRSLAGRELVAINGVPFRDFAAPVFARCSGEIFPFKATRFTGAQGFWWAISGLFSGLDKFELETRDASGRRFVKSVSVIGIDAADKLRNSIPKKEADSTRLEMMEKGSVAYFRYPTFDYSDAEMKRVDGIFSEAGKAGAVAMIIDIRGNGGGNSNMGDYIMKYITEKATRTYSKMQVKVSRELLSSPKYSGSMRKESLGVPPGTLVTSRSPEEKQSKPGAFFKGKLYLLADNGTFSSATDFAAMFRDYECGKIIGYETGGLPICFGDVFSLALSNSRIPFGVSYKKFYNSRPRPGDDEHGVLPDIPVTAEILRKHKTPDPVLSFALDHIKSDK